MKLLLTALVVLNVLLFGWFRGWMAPFGGDGRESERVQRQVQPQELRVVPMPRPPAAPAGAARNAPTAGAAVTGGAAASSAATASAGAGAPRPTEPPVDPGSQGAFLKSATCVVLGPMSELDAVRAQGALDAAAADLTVALSREDETTSWWVYLPASPGDLSRRVADLRSRGIADIYVMPDGAWKGAISLGLFRQEELAVALQRSITERGVRGVRVAPRGPSPGRVSVMVQPVPPPVAAELERLRTQHPDAVLRPCARG